MSNEAGLVHKMTPEEQAREIVRRLRESMGAYPGNYSRAEDVITAALSEQNKEIERLTKLYETTAQCYEGAQNRYAAAESRLAEARKVIAAARESFVIDDERGAWRAIDGYWRQHLSTPSPEPSKDGAGLLSILKALFGEAPIEEKIGWHKVRTSSPEMFGCELCGAEHPNCALIPHQSNCPITLGRAALSQFQRSEGK